MSSSDPQRALSAENSRRLRQALALSDQLQTAAPTGDSSLSELKLLLDSCRDGVRRQNPDHRRQRLEAVDQARNYLHFLPNMQHGQASGRLRSVSRRLRRALRD
jgi:hypothetical protein